MIDIAEFAATTGIDDREAYEVLREELEAPQKSLAHRCADLAEGLRQIGLDERDVMTAVEVLARERRR